MNKVTAPEGSETGGFGPNGGGRGVVLKKHRLRLSLANEVHARPYEVLDAPVRVTHLAIMSGQATRSSGEGDGAGAAAAGDAHHAHLCDLCDRYALAPPSPDAIYFGHDLTVDGTPTLTPGGLRVRWERHSEFSTYTFYRFDDFDPSAPFAETALDLVPTDWLATLPGEVLVATHVTIGPGSDIPDLQTLFGDHLVVGSALGDGAGLGWSDIRLHSDGFGRMLIHSGNLTRGQVGRMVQRILEMETYRMMALLAFPVARDMGPQLSRLENEVATLIGIMADPQEDRATGPNNDRRLLDRLIDVAAETEGLMAAHSYRFGAAKAYQAIVDRSINELRETRLTGTQTFREFMDRRFAPAMRTCQAMAERADALGRRVARASDMLRTRVDISLEENNRDLLNSMNRRADAQLRLQETVEGLSVVAISYYLWSLVHYLLEGAEAAGLHINPDLAALVAVPLVVILVFIGVKRLKAAVARRKHDPDPKA